MSVCWLLELTLIEEDFSGINFFVRKHAGSPFKGSCWLCWSSMNTSGL